MRNKTITGASGEFFVASYLSALNLVVALPRGGVPSSDLLITNERGEKTISLQVKSARKPFNKSIKYGDYLAWPASSKEITVSDKHWYALVDLKNWPEDDKIPEVFFMPSEKFKSGIEKGKWSFFCLSLSEANQYKGQEGHNNLLMELQKT
jgi:hypothetical protein